MTPCPSSESLRQLLADRLSDSEARGVEAHVETCVACQQTLERLTDDDHVRKGQRPVSHGAPGGEFLLRLGREPLIDAWPDRDRSEKGKDGQGPTPRDPGGLAAELTVTMARGPQSAGEVRTLLRKRLLTIAVVIWVVFAVYAVGSPLLFGEEPLLPWICGLLLALSGGLAGWLWSGRPLSLRQLRGLEVGLFTSLAALFTWIECRFFPYGLFSHVPPGDTSGAAFLARGLCLHWFSLVVAYGVLIPNTWRRCVAVVGGLTAWALLLNAVLILRNPTTVMVPSFLLEAAIRMGTAAALAVYGAHRIETLRQQAARAGTLGQYRLKQLLGAGGMGEVYLAEHALLRRPCALKLIRPERAGDPKQLLRFEREVQATVALSHPNIVEVFDYGRTEDGTFYYVMEYLPGLNLEELVRRHGPLSPERVVHLLQQVCGALQEAHAAGLVHRDIKPGNLLVSQRGGRQDVAKLLDFGLVQALGLTPGEPPLTQEGTLAGTPGYMSPEQAAGQADLGAGSDLYSLGAVAYFLLTGQPPFVRGTAVQTLAAHIGEAVVPPGRVRPDLPADLQAVVLRCLEKEPARRFPDAGALAQALSCCRCAGEWTSHRAAAWWANPTCPPA